MQGEVPFQRGLFERGPSGFDAGFSQLQRIDLGGGAWLEHQPGWVRGADALFLEVLQSRDWGQRVRWMYERKVREPRLTSPWRLDDREPLQPELVEEMRRCLGARYGRELDSVGFNLYRDGQDSVAWHRDHVDPEIAEPLIALVSLGEPRKFLVRPHGGGASRSFMLGRGDLLVTGGTFNRTWEHAVPKVARAGPRISLAFRHGLDPRAYAHKKTVPPDR